MAALLDVLGVRRHGLVARLSAQLASWMLRGGGGQVILQGSLAGAVVLIPIYPPKKPWRPSGAPPERMPEAASRELARLSLVALLATWRAGGIAAPVTAELLEPQRDRERRLLAQPEWKRCEISAALQQWQPEFVLSFGPLDEIFLLTATNRRSPWALRVPHVRLKLERQGRAPPMPIRAVELKNDSKLDPAEVALSFSGGEEISFGDLLSAVSDPAGNMPFSSEGAAGIISLLRMAQERFPSTSRPRERPWWEDQDQWQGLAGPSAWPPKRLPKLQTMWVAVDAADPSRQGRTVDGHIYYWNRETNETSWTRPWGGRRSEQVRTRLPNLLGARGSPFGARLMRKAAGGILGRRSSDSSGRQHQRDQVSLGLVLEYMGTRGRMPARQAVMQEQP
ncbi:unnamed protein product [Symbiodinium necroappetens]|uniref:WW domain-containing protein n=1 Tax=Symbiodinium necroappetens TaxID=1628268 RepID=A0A812VYR2_9DINO|nr:unnamed protein product [Symbiodinium necroappetens]